MSTSTVTAFAGHNSVTLGSNHRRKGVARIHAQPVSLPDRGRRHLWRRGGRAFSPQALRDTVDAALAIARFTAEDDCAGLADAALMARECPDLDLYHPWALDVEALP